MCVCTRVLVGEVGMSELSLKWNSNVCRSGGRPLGGDLQEGFPTPHWEGRGMNQTWPVSYSCGKEAPKGKKEELFVLYNRLHDPRGHKQGLLEVWVTLCDSE